MGRVPKRSSQAYIYIYEQSFGRNSGELRPFSFFFLRALAKLAIVFFESFREASHCFFLSKQNSPQIVPHAPLPYTQALSVQIYPLISPKIEREWSQLSFAGLGGGSLPVFASLLDTGGGKNPILFLYNTSQARGANPPGTFFQLKLQLAHQHFPLSLASLRPRSIFFQIYEYIYLRNKRERRGRLTPWSQTVLQQPARSCVPLPKRKLFCFGQWNGLYFFYFYK